MKKPFSLRFLLVLTLISALVPVATGSSTALAQDDLPTAREVVDRFVEATGAAKTIEEHDSMISTGSFAIPAQGMEGRMTIRAKKPNLLLVEIELPGFGQIRQGYDGEVGWAVDPAQGPQLLLDESLVQLRDQANFFSSLYREEDLETLEMVGRTTFDEEEVYEVKMVTTGGSESTQYFSVESGLLVGREVEQHTPMGAIPVRSSLGQYEKFGDFLVPTKTTDAMMGMQQIITIETVEMAPVEDSVFDLPPSVAALVGDEGDDEQ